MTEREWRKYMRILSKELKTAIQQYPEFKKVENHHRAVKYTVLQFYPSFQKLDQKVLLDFVKCVVHLDRAWRYQTEGIDKKKKQVLSQEFQVAMYKE